MVGYHKRFDPAYRRTREEVRRLRNLRFVDVTVLHPDEEAFRRHHALLPRRSAEEMSEQQMDRLSRRVTLRPARRIRLSTLERG